VPANGAVLTITPSLLFLAVNFPPPLTPQEGGSYPHRQYIMSASAQKWGDRGYEVEYLPHYFLGPVWLLVLVKIFGKPRHRMLDLKTSSQPPPWCGCEAALGCKTPGGGVLSSRRHTISHYTVQKD